MNGYPRFGWVDILRFQHVDALIVKHVENLSDDRHAEEKGRALCERNEIEATFGTSKRVYRANDIRAKLDTSVIW